MTTADTLKDLAEKLGDLRADYETDDGDSYVTVPVGYLQAIEIEPADDELQYVVFFRAWDQSHGLEVEEVLFTGAAEDVPGRVRAFIAEEEKHAREVDEAMFPSDDVLREEEAMAGADRD